MNESMYTISMTFSQRMKLERAVRLAGAYDAFCQTMGMGTPVGALDHVDLDELVEVLESAELI